MALKCVLCEMCHLPSERCGRDTVGGLDRSEALDRARGVLRAAEIKAGVAYSPPRDLPMPKAEFEAPVMSSGGLQGKEVMPLPQIPTHVLSKAPDAPHQRPGPGGFDRAAHHKAYMRAYMKGYMRAWRARRKGLV